MELIRPESALKELYIHDLGKGPVLGVSPHDDDVLFKCGGLFYLACSKGIPTYVIVVTDGSLGYPHPKQKGNIVENREEETIEAYGALGIGPDHIKFLRITDRKVYEYIDEACYKIVEFTRKKRPETVFIPKNGHIDHFYVNLICKDTFRGDPYLPELGKPVEPKQVFEYSVWDEGSVKKIRYLNSSGQIGVLNVIEETHCFKLPKEVQEIKRKAAYKFESQKKVIRKLEKDSKMNWEVEIFNKLR